MVTLSEAVAVVVDPDFGHRLRDLGSRMHLWICDSAANTAAVEELRASGGSVTAFRAPPDEGPEDLLLGLLPELELHHGSLSQDPPWKEIVVHGVFATPSVQAALDELGFTRAEALDSGFRCVRP